MNEFFFSLFLFYLPLPSLDGDDWNTNPPFFLISCSSLPSPCTFVPVAFSSLPRLSCSWPGLSFPCIGCPICHCPCNAACAALLPENWVYLSPSMRISASVHCAPLFASICAASSRPYSMATYRAPSIHFLILSLNFKGFSHFTYPLGENQTIRLIFFPSFKCL